MYINRDVNKFGVVVRVIHLTPEGEVIHIAKRLNFMEMTNKAKYEACALGMKTLMASRVLKVEIKGDSMLVINQTTKE